jgi:hypothetical protein
MLQLSQHKEMPSAWREKPELQILAAEHQNWLVNLVTQRLLNHLQRRKQTVESNLCGASVTPAKTSDMVRILAIQLNEIRELEQMIFNTEKFITATTTPPLQKVT